MCMCRKTLAVALAAGVFALPACEDTAPPKKPAPVTATPKPTPPPVKKDPAVVLAEARAAIGKVRAVSYNASAVRAKGGEVIATGEVTATRAEAGGWMLHTKGTSQGKADAAPVATGEGTPEAPAKAAPPKTVPFEIGYDGATARSVKQEDQIVFETSAFEWDELLEFLTAQGARPIIAWEIFAEDALPGDDARLAFDGQETVDGTLCDLVSIRPAEGTAGPAAQYAIAVSDRLPRRITRVGDDAGIVELKSVRTDGDVFSAVYSLPTPTGFRIRDPGRALVKIGDAPAKEKGTLLGDPENRVQAAMEPMKVGDVAPAWELKDAAGKNVTLADFKGKVLVMDFWGTWCGWCVKAMPALEAVHKKYQGKGVVVLGLNTENSPSADPAGFMRRNNFTYGLVLNAEKITKTYKVFGYPQLYVVGPDGTIVGSEQGYSPDLEEKLSKIIDAVLPKN